MGEGFLRGSCDAVFATAAGANAHGGRVHRIGTMVSIKEFVTSSCCPVCGKDFRCRDDSRNACRGVLLAGGIVRADAEALAAAEAVDRATTRVAKALGLGPLVALGQYAE